MSDTRISNPNQAKESTNIEYPSRVQFFTACQAWYLVHCKPNGEQVARRNLENQDIRTFLPLQKLTRRKGTAFQAQLRPLFPGYIFVAQDPAAGQWRKINNTRGVARLVQFATEPMPVPPQIMEQLFACCDATSVFQQNAHLTSGDDVKITHGPFAGAFGKIIEIEPSQRVHLLLDFMGQKSTLSMDKTSVISVR